ncbi:MAG: PTS transporter subunit EIIC [Acidaminococcaceae bacterium]|nr:PTS transporter subunit EIIC [Acidaminococcaceae bacterium]MBQ9636062.1 PTS transporter subunit EIIC [Acidaminococcaceae bacterium]MBQ9698579.1 PTS transporter subunit EIIC [Acidaminococcaceae bacterium]
MDNQQTAKQILDAVGPENITEAYNCMTRLRLHVKTVSVTKEELKKIPGVKGVIMNENEIHVVLGPGKAESVAKECKRLLAPQAAEVSPVPPAAAETAAPPAKKQASFGDGKELHAAIKKQNSRSALKRLLQRIGHIFIPLIPAFIGCGLLTGVISLLLKISPGLASEPLLQYLRLAGSSIFTVLNAFIGMYACREFGGTPALGGAMAALLTAPGLADISLFGSPLVPGRGGVFASLLAGAATALIETRLRRRVPDAASLFLTPFITIIIVSLASIFVFQPLGGYISDFLGYYTVHTIQTGGAVTGFVIGGLFLPVVMAGVHHGLTPIHADMLASMGMTILLPIAAMAGCGQVGASFAVYLKSKNKELKRTVLSSLPVGIMGIGEPLIYGVTLPLGKPFVCACIGGACGGAWQAYHGIGSYALGISGVPLAAATNNALLYLGGVFIAWLAGFAATWLAGFDDPPEENTSLT